MKELEKIWAGGGLEVDVSSAAEELAGNLLAHLAPLFPTISSATKSDAGAEAWVRSWSAQIQLTGLRPWQIERGLARLGEHDPDIPFSWPVFYRLCRCPFRDVNDAERGRDDPEYRADQERKRREFLAKYPNARFVN